jgi:hypothetical protein
MELSDEAVRKICSCAQFRKLRRGDAIFCKEARGKDPANSIEFMAIKDGEICLATDFYSTGHAGYDWNVNVEKMKGCPYKK